VFAQDYYSYSLNTTFSIEKRKQLYKYFTFVSDSGGHYPPDSLLGARGVAPGPHWRTCIPQRPWLSLFWKICGSTCEPLHCTSLGMPMACTNWKQRMYYYASGSAH